MTAYPSTAELSNGGVLISAKTSSASTDPADSSSGIRTAGKVPTPAISAFWASRTVSMRYSLAAYQRQYLVPLALHHLLTHSLQVEADNGVIGGRADVEMP